MDTPAPVLGPSSGSICWSSWPCWHRPVDVGPPVMWQIWWPARASLMSPRADGRSPRAPRGRGPCRTAATGQIGRSVCRVYWSCYWRGVKASWYWYGKATHSIADWTSLVGSAMVKRASGEKPDTEAFMMDTILWCLNMVKPSCWRCFINSSTIGKCWRIMDVDHRNKGWDFRPSTVQAALRCVEEWAILPVRRKWMKRSYTEKWVGAYSIQWHVISTTTLVFGWQTAAAVEFCW